MRCTCALHFGQNFLPEFPDSQDFAKFPRKECKGVPCNIVPLHICFQLEYFLSKLWVQRRVSTMPELGISWMIFTPLALAHMFEWNFLAFERCFNIFAFHHVIVLVYFEMAEQNKPTEENPHQSPKVVMALPSTSKTAS